MAKTKQTSAATAKSRKKKEEQHLRIALTKTNYMIIGIGIIVIIIGYIFMSENSVDGFLPTVIAPILLIIGYCVIVPLGLLYKDKKDDSISTATEETEASPAKTNTNVKTSSNVKTT